MIILVYFIRKKCHCKSYYNDTNYHMSSVAFFILEGGGGIMNYIFKYFKTF